MIGDSSFEKNKKNNKEIIQTNEEMTTKIKLFNFFYNILKKKDFNIVVTCLLIILETIQVISYGFSEPHTKFWKISSKKMDNLNTFFGAIRGTQLFKYVSFSVYLIIWSSINFLIFLTSLIISMSVKINNPNSSLYKFVIAYSKFISCIMMSVGLIPSTEVLLLMLKCENRKISIVKNPIKCYQGLHFLYIGLTIIFLLGQYLLNIIFGMFYFDPYNTKQSISKINTSADLFYYIISLINSIRYAFIKNEWISITILLITSLFNLKKGFDEPTYGNYILQSAIVIRNSLFLWTSFMVMICKLTYDSKFGGNIYLFIFCMPLIVITCGIYYKKKNENIILTNSNSGSAYDFINKTKSIIILVGKYIDKYKSVESSKKGYDKNDIFLKGLISCHLETCVSEECPLSKYMENQGNFQIQKNCLLHYINLLLIDGIKKFPNNKNIVMTFIQFNYANKFNLNAAKTYLTKLEKESNTITEDFILFCIKQSVNSLNNKVNTILNIEDDIEKIEELKENKFRKLKFLIESTTKLYGEFWGVLSTNLTNNLNLEKLYFLGNKLNILLDEINEIWEKFLKNSKIDLENQSIVQLYAYFTREILRNKTKADEISKKLNEEQHFESKKNENDRFDIDNLDIILEDQDYVIFSRTNEKGDCSVIQMSNSIVNLLGFTKQNLIGKKIEILMPNIFMNGHPKAIANKLKILRKLNPTMNKASDKRQIFFLPRTKVGYILPAIVKFTIYNDDDFSNTFIIKAKIDNKDPKSVYAFYILAKDDFTIDSFSSSALSMGLTMDLLKKYVVNLNILVRNSNNCDILNLPERYNEFEDEPKRITWIFPDKIYPKNDTIRIVDENIEKLVKQSKKKDFNLSIIKMKFGDEEPIGFCFRFTELETKKNNIDLNDFRQSTRKLIMYDILKLGFVRTCLVNNKKNKNEFFVRPKNNTLINIINSNNEILSKRVRKVKIKKSKYSDEEENDEDKNKDDFNSNFLSKEIIIEYQNRNSQEINEYINSLKYYGVDVNLEKHRPNKELYPVGKITEPMIKIQISTFIHRIEEKLNAHPELRRNVYNKINNTSNNKIKVNFANQEILNNDKNSSNPSQNENHIIQNETNEINGGDISLSLNHIFNEKSVTYIKFSSVIMFILILAFISIEFGLSIYKIHKCAQYINYLDDSYILLNSFLYTKFFLTEVILSQNSSYTDELGEDQKEYVFKAKNEMVEYRQIINDYIAFFSNATVTFNNFYYDYINNVKVHVRTISNFLPTIEIISYSSALNRIKTSIFFVSTITDNYLSLDLNNRYAYELMMNLLNDYFIIMRNVTFILAENTNDEAKSPLILLIIFILSFIFVIIDLIIMWKLISKFIDDREKPVDLFLTIKKKKFEELKSTSENFLNKLLNKFFGNEETEEEQSKIEYTLTSKDEDIIMITKFKQKNDYKQSIKNSSEYLIAFIYISLFFAFIQIYMIFKFFYVKSIMGNIKHFIKVFNTTHYSDCDIILKTNIYKSYYYNSSIPILNNTNTEEIFYLCTITLDNEIEYLYGDSYEAKSFLQKKYINEFSTRMASDISDIIKNVSEISWIGTIEFGFNCVLTKYFEINKFLAILYLIQKDNLTEPFFCHKKKFIEINKTLIYVIRPWFKYMINQLKECFSDYKDKIDLIIDSAFILLIFIVIIIYFILWKGYEEKLKNLLKTSVDLIKLIPDEIKKEIVKKLTEEEEKGE